MSQKTKPQDPVQRARAAVSGAIGQLIKLVGHEDEDVVRRAVYALYEIGPFAVGPLATALGKEPNSRIRVAIICLLLIFSREARNDVSAALLIASHRDPDPDVRLAAWAAHAQVIADNLPPARTARSRATDATSTNTDRSEESGTAGGDGTTPTA
jgi:HEAT repeat protein